MVYYGIFWSGQLSNVGDFSWSLFLRTVSRLKMRKNKRQSVTACGYCFSFVEHIAVKKECTKCKGRNEQR